MLFVSKIAQRTVTLWQFSLQPKWRIFGLINKITVFHICETAVYISKNNFLISIRWQCYTVWVYTIMLNYVLHSTLLSVMSLLGYVYVL